MPCRVRPRALRGLWRVRAVRPSDGCPLRSRRASRPAFAPGQRAAGHAVRRLDGKPSATGKAREPLPFARRLVRFRSRQAQPCAPSRCRMFDRRNRAPPITRNQGAPVTPSGISSSATVRRPCGVRVRAPCAACGASAPSVRRMVAACALCAPVPSVPRSSRCARRPVRFDLDGRNRARRSKLASKVCKGKLGFC